MELSTIEKQNEKIKMQVNGIPLAINLNYETQTILIEDATGETVFADDFQNIHVMILQAKALLKACEYVKHHINGNEYDSERAEKIKGFKEDINKTDEICDKVLTDAKDIFLRGTTKEVEKQFGAKEEKKYVLYTMDNGNKVVCKIIWEYEKGNFVMECERSTILIDDLDYVPQEVKEKNTGKKVWLINIKRTVPCNSKGELI